MIKSKTGCLYLFLVQQINGVLGVQGAIFLAVKKYLLINHLKLEWIEWNV